MKGPFFSAFVMENKSGASTVDIGILLAIIFSNYKITNY
ncbi:hypothetical protein BN997_02066 [Oceanobacillus oncorhynchi]|uniref:Uncharacterized protein n=1 Tax=Oceanobacillus oncorhynchi TaxID=545501 RepID=A0A0A1MRG7_9BACI|nr:hypothetical protein BN997_02066 [Oceanobacillus oncorhynchi]